MGLSKPNLLFLTENLDFLTQQESGK